MLKCVREYIDFISRENILNNKVNLPYDPKTITITIHNLDHTLKHLLSKNNYYDKYNTFCHTNWGYYFCVFFHILLFFAFSSISTWIKWSGVSTHRSTLTLPMVGLGQMSRLNGRCSPLPHHTNCFFLNIHHTRLIVWMQFYSTAA